MALQVAPAYVVRAMTSQLPLPEGQGEAPSTQPVRSLMNVADVGWKPRGTFVPTGPVKAAAVGDGVGLGVLVTVGAAVVVTVGLGVGVGVGAACFALCEHAETS